MKEEMLRRAAMKEQEDDDSDDDEVKETMPFSFDSSYLSTFLNMLILI